MPLSDIEKNILRNHVSPGAQQIELDTLLNNIVKQTPGATTFAVGAEATNAIAVAVQLNDVKGGGLAEKRECLIWLSDTAAAAPSAVAPSGTVAVTGGVVVKEDTAKVAQRVLSGADGKFTVTVTEASAKSYYLNVSHKGRVSSQIITFA